jgi:hypothetical protein
MSEQAEPFKLAVPMTAIADLRERLERTRLPDRSPGPSWAYGTDVDWMRGLIEYWRDTFDWRVQEVRCREDARIVPVMLRASLCGLVRHWRV